MSKISFTSHGYRLAGNIFMAEKPHSLAFLFIQGWMGNQNTAAARALANIGFMSMTYDMRGNKTSEGNLADFSRADFLSDAATACDFLKEQVSSDTQIGVVGSSFGSYTGVLLSKIRPVLCLSLRVPANYPDEGFNDSQETQRFASHDFVDWRQKLFSFEENHATKALHNFKGKVQIIVAGADEMIPGQVSENYIDAIADKSQLDYKVMEGAPHSLVNEKLSAEYTNLLTDWVKQFTTA